MRLLPAVLALAACAPDPAGPVPAWDPEGSSLFDAPWPSDERVADGHPDLSGFPNPLDLPLIDQMKALGTALDGFSTNAPVYVRFDGPIDPDRLPTPDGSLETGSSLVLVDVDPSSAHFGQRWPVQWQWTEGETTYQPGNLLAVAPVYGFPLDPRTTYALIVTTDVASPNPDFAKVWDPKDARHADFATLQDALFFLGLSNADVAVATVFTTGDPTSEMARMARFVRHDVAPADLDQDVRFLSSNAFYQVFAGHYQGPVFQRGERPYSQEGGGFEFADDGQPIVQSWDDMRISICTPLDVSDPPAGGWPVVIQAHGTGGDYLSHCSDPTGDEVASQLAHVGMISIGFDQPLYGTRVGDTPTSDYDTFNFLNPEAGRSNFRQGALDIVYLARTLASRQATFTGIDGTVIRTDPSKVYLLGHSQGGLTGAIAVPFTDGDVKAAVLSGAGGVLSITVVERKDPIDIAAAVEAVARFSDDEELTEFHPLVGLVQTLTDVTDPVNYSPYWYAETAPWPDHQPTSVLLTSGLLDEETTHATAEALAIAARMPQLSPEANDPEGFALRGLTPIPSAFSGDETAFDGTSVTSILSQYPDNDHWAIWENRDAAHLYRHFLMTAARDGVPEIDDHSHD